MNRLDLRRRGAPLLLLAALAACATPPPVAEPVAPLPLPAAKAPSPRARVDETAMLPLLGYLQLLAQLSGAELAHERRVLAAIPQTPATRVRQAMLLAQARGAADLTRANGLLEQVLKSAEPAAVSLHPLALALSTQYHERQRLQAQGERLQQQLSDSQRRSGELELKLDALAAIERSLPERRSGTEPPP